jgi:solute carrier family 25 phosphate transporter 3
MDYLHLGLPNPIPDVDPRYFLSGGLCAAVSHGITTPIDVVKTKMQANPVYGELGVVGAAQIIIQDEGAGTLLRGLGPTIVGYGLEGAAKFGLYESLKPEMVRLMHTPNPAIPYLIASVAAGAVAAIMLCPMEKTRIRLVTDPDFSGNLFTGIPQLVEESGLFSLFGGLVAMLSKQVPYTFAKQVSFDAIAAFLYAAAANANFAAKDVKLEISLTAALFASVLACLLSHPGDVILTKTYKASKDCRQGFIDVVSEIYDDQGIKGFFSGLPARFLHVGGIITSQLVLYDTIKQLLGLPATGT